LVGGGRTRLVRGPGPWSATWRCLELVGIAAGVYGVWVGALALRNDLENSEEDRVNRAWSLVAAAKIEAPATSG
jgi:hypothetical protein